MTISLGIPPQLGDRRILHPGKWLPARAIGWVVTLIFAIVLASYALLVRTGEARNPVELDLHAAPVGLMAGLAFGLALFSIVMFILVAIGFAERQLPDWLTGGAFGLEASLPCLVVCVAAGGAVLWLALRAGRFEATTRSGARCSSG